MSDDNEDYQLGYGKPPKHSQFTKGRSGNPKGRPVRARSFKDDLTAELQKKQTALARSLTDAAMTDPRALKTLLAFMRHFGIGDEEHTVETSDVIDEHAFLESHFGQERVPPKQSNPDSAPPEPNARAPKENDE
jgi:hypothetical protein